MGFGWQDAPLQRCSRAAYDRMRSDAARINLAAGSPILEAQQIAFTHNIMFCMLQKQVKSDLGRLGLRETPRDVSIKEHVISHQESGQNVALPDRWTFTFAISYYFSAISIN